jgi:sporulation protein YhbH
MSDHPSSFIEQTNGGKGWYDLFSRGARDWLRHNDKVSEAVRRQLPELISKVDVLGPKPSTTVRVPVRFLEHFRFRLREDDNRRGVGQGKGKAGDKLVPARPEQGEGKGEGGNEEGGYQFVLELKIDDIVEWLWEELKLPHLKQKEGKLEDSDYTREGWNRRGVRSRLDRRRSIKEAIKRRATRPPGNGPDSSPRKSPTLTNDDLRFRQLVMRKQPTTEAVVFFAMDVSSSMSDQERKLAKTFFFWVVQGLRRQYTHIEPVFIAHTVEAWEFAEQEFFQVTASGGTVASTAFNKALEITRGRYDPGRYNIYTFYASDGANFSSDHQPAEQALAELARLSNFVGYVETSSGPQITSPSETGKIFDTIKSQGGTVGSYELHDADSVWNAIRGFFTEHAEDRVEAA